LRALILAAGLGTRLRPLTDIRAKAAVPVNGVPLVRRVASWLVAQAFTDLVVNLHHRPASITRGLGDGRDIGARVRYSWEHPVLGSAGGPRRALPLLVDSSGATAESDRSFLMVNGDTLTELDLRELLARHERSEALVTMALIRNPRPDVYGGVVVRDGWISGFSRAGSSAESFHFIGVQAARASAFADLPDGVPSESVMQVYPRLMQENPRALAAHIVDAPFSDIGTPADYLQTSCELAAREGDRLLSSAGSEIAASAHLRRTAVWDRVRIGEDVDLDECIVCDVRPGERIDAGLLIRDF
jgi:mannose-1-phosphate guanylyltransferase